MIAKKRLVDFLKPYRLWIVLAPLLMTAEVVLNLLQPRFVQQIVDVGIANKDLNLVIHTSILMVVTSIIGAFGGMSNGVFAEMTVQGFGLDVREYLFRKVQTFAFGDVDEFETGQLITRLTNDVTQVQEAILMILRMMIRAPLLLIGSLVMALITSPQLAFLLFILMLIELLVLILVINKATPLYTIVQEKLDRLNEVMQENLAGVRMVKAFVRGNHEETRFAGANEDLTRQAVKAGRTVAVMPSFMMLTMNLGIASVLWFGGIQIMHGSMHDGQIIAFINYLTQTLFSLMMVSQLVIQLSRAMASAKRIQQVIDKDPAIQNRPAALTTPLRGEVVFDDVTFNYRTQDSDPVLKGVSFTALPGQTVALLGSTGSGKSSLVHLIPRFYDVTSGRILIDGQDVRDLDQETLRRSIGLALQETVLFSGTIRDNMRYGRPDASEDEVIDAAKAAQAHDFILSFADGYDTVLGQRGVNLSGGQKQRIAIARALLIRPAILILDDSTSAVDVETETRIQQALEIHMKRSTSFVIAQRISTVLTADKILVLEDGQICAQGTHRELMETSSIYRDIYDSQLGSGVAVPAAPGSLDPIPGEVSHD